MKEMMAYVVRLWSHLANIFAKFLFVLPYSFMGQQHGLVSLKNSFPNRV
jgi:hypothetical protein